MKTLYRYFTCFVLGVSVQTLSAAEAVPDNTLPGFTILPLAQVYPRYIADPYRTAFAVKTLFYNRTDVPNSGKNYVALAMGGAFPLVQYNWQAVQSQLVLEGGYHGFFDADQAEDNLGWEGIYAFYLASRFNDRLATRIGYRHFSSHVGDEYAERNGRLRINYTREELRGGINWEVLANLQWYYDVGYAVSLRNKNRQKRWRHQTGLQYDRPKVFFDSALGWYAAMDVSLYEENDYATNTTLQSGFIVKRQQREWRFFIEYYNGRTQLGEFFENRESYYSLGFTIDI